MTAWPLVPLGEVCAINPRLARDERPDDDVPVTFVPMAAVDETEGAIVAAGRRPYREVAKGYTPFRDGDVLFAKITPCMENGKAAIASDLVGGLGFGSTEFHVLRPGSRLDRGYLYHFVRMPEFRRRAKAHFTGTAGQQRVPASFLDGFPLPLPPLPEQRRIVDILDRAASIRRLRRQAQETARQIIPALFVKMFGDPASNPMGWPVRLLGEVMTGCDYGTSEKASDDAVGMPVIRMGNVTYDGRLDLRTLKYMNDDGNRLDRYALEPGDLLFNRTNSKELVGKMGMWAGDMKAVAASYFIRVRLDEGAARPAFIWGFFNSGFMKRRLFATARGAIGQANINTKELRAFRVILPPLRLQDEYQRRLRLFQAMSRRAADAQHYEAAAFSALSARLLG